VSKKLTLPGEDAPLSKFFVVILGIIGSLNNLPPILILIPDKKAGIKLTLFIL
jgi:hypothetical protein